MNILRTKINIGADKPFTVIHASDTHITLADERDGERKVKLAERRANCFPESDEMFENLIKLQNETGDFLVYTGDLIDFVSVLNLEKAKEFADKTDCFFAAGNHEFSLYVGEAKEDATYRNQSLRKVQETFNNDIRFSSRIVNGVNFVAVDNSYYFFEKYQLDALKKETEKGLPIVLCMHNPVYSEELYEYILNKDGRDKPAYLMAVPEEKMKHYSPDRYEQQKADEITYAAYDYILNERLMKTVLAGHVHCPFEYPVGNKMQYGVGCTDVRIIEFI